MAILDAAPEVAELLTWLTVEKGRSRNTIEAYRRDLDAYTDWLRQGGLATSDVTTADLQRYVATLRVAGRAPSSAARAVAAIRQLHRFLVDEGVRADDPSADLEPPRVPAGIPKPLSEQEVAALLAAPQGADPVARRDRALLELLYATGMRVSELCGLSLGDLDLDTRLVRVFGKGAKERIVPFGHLAATALAEWLADGGRPALVPDRWARRDDAVRAVPRHQGPAPGPPARVAHPARAR